MESKHATDRPRPSAGMPRHSVPTSSSPARRGGDHQHRRRDRRHDTASSDESPEERLLTILEQSGEVEVLDAEEALGDCEVYFEEQASPPANDNTRMAVL